MSHSSSFIVGCLTAENQGSDHLPGLRLFESFPTRELAAVRAKELAEQHLVEITRLNADAIAENIKKGYKGNNGSYVHKIAKLPAGYAVYDLEFGEIKEGSGETPANYDLFFVQEVKPYTKEDVSGVFNSDATLLLEAPAQVE